MLAALGVKGGSSLLKMLGLTGDDDPLENAWDIPDLGDPQSDDVFSKALA
jgi:hypothetical protein